MIFFNILTRSYTCDECYRDVNPVDNSGHKVLCSGSNEAYAKWQEADAKNFLALHTKICGCSWSLTSNIFGKEYHV